MDNELKNDFGTLKKLISHKISVDNLTDEEVERLIYMCDIMIEKAQEDARKIENGNY